MRRLIILGVIATVSIACNGVAARAAWRSYQALIDCAREQNVFECEYKAQPVTAPKVAYIEKELLPPPSSKDYADK